MPASDPLADLLAIAPDVYRRTGELAGLGVLSGSTAASDASRPLGNLVRSGATAAVGNAVDHLLAWSTLYLRGLVVPSFAHYTLMRSAIEGASTVRWLIDPTVEASDRIARAIGVAINDLEERGKVERAASPEARALVPDDAVDSPTRIAEIREAAKLAGQPIDRRGHTYLVANFGPGEMAYRVLCAHAHGGQSVTLATSSRSVADLEDPDELRRIRLEANPDYTLGLSESTVRYTQAAVLELYVYQGHGGQPTPPATG